jgi:hypothetical protein
MFQPTPITHPPRLGKDPAFEQTEISSYIQVKFDRDDDDFSSFL